LTAEAKIVGRGEAQLKRGGSKPGAKLRTHSCVELSAQAQKQVSIFRMMPGHESRAIDGFESAAEILRHSHHLERHLCLGVKAAGSKRLYRAACCA
jgi:hypothetical protein